MYRKTLAGGTLICVLAGLLCGFWPRPRPHLLLITLDTVRADRLTCYGYAAGRTPALDSLAASGVLCERAYTVAPLTLPAHASLFTGLHPRENGLTTNARGRLDETIPTLAETLQRQGYSTAAFVASFVLNRKFGLDRGFNFYDDDFAGEEPAPDALHRQRQGESVVDAALNWLSQKRSQPFFCWVHLYDAHAPYFPHSELFGDEFADRPYDAEIAYVDRQVSRLIDFLIARGLDSQTLVVVAGDHGEGLGEHIERTHGSTLYNGTLRVPLIFHQPARLASGRRVTGDVSLVDVAPTILDLLGSAALREISGRSILSALQGRDSQPAACYGATDEPFLLNGWSPLRSVTAGDRKYIRTTRVELYDLAHDPGERHNLADADPEGVREMEALLADVEARMVPRAAVAVQLSATERRALASLGYAAGAVAVPASEKAADLPDVKDMLPFDVAVEDAIQLIRRGARDAGIARLRGVIQEVPTHTAAYTFLAEALKENREFGDATQVFLSLLDVKPQSREGYYGLGNILLEQGRLDAAIGEFRKSLEIDPEYVEAHYNLAAALVHTGQPAGALDQFGEVLRIDRCNGAAWQGRANVLVSLGRIAESIGDYRMALKYAPDAADTHHNLGVVLADLGESREAREHLRRAVELVPQNPQIQFSWGAFLLREREYSAAVKPLAKVLDLMPDHPAAPTLLNEAREKQ